MIFYDTLQILPKGIRKKSMGRLHDMVDDFVRGRAAGHRRNSSIDALRILGIDDLGCEDPMDRKRYIGKLLLIYGPVGESQTGPHEIERITQAFL